MPKLLVLSTRPAEDSAELALRLADLPLEFCALPASEPRLYSLDEIDHAALLAPADVWFFPSRYPVTVLSYLEAEQRRRLRCACPGPGTAKALADWDVGEVLLPQQEFTSEALLDLPQLQQMAGRRVKILSAPGGREAVASVLAARGAEVVTLNVYERYTLTPSAEQLAMLAWSQLPWLTVITSGQGLLHLQQHLATQAWQRLCRMTVLVPSERLFEQAQALHIQHALVLAPPDNVRIAEYIRANFNALSMQALD